MSQLVDEGPEPDTLHNPAHTQEHAPNGGWKNGAHLDLPFA
jgi:hypothetical protein